MAEKPDTFAARLKVLREAATLSVAELALKAGVSRKHVYSLEAGEQSPSLAVAAQLAKALGGKSLKVFDGCEG